MNYIYGRQGVPCQTITSVNTSNTKFLQPLNKLYFKTKTYMLKYPGSEENNPKFKNTNELDHIYYGKTFENNNHTLEKLEELEELEELEQIKKCSSCSSS